MHRRYHKLCSISLLLLVSLTPLTAGAWGAHAHRLVTDLAVDVLPGPCAPLFRANRSALMHRAVEPDTVLRERQGQREAVRHFIDLDAYMPYPFTGVPRFYREAVAQVGRGAVHARGVLPWAILRLRGELRAAARAGDRGALLRGAGYLSHYVADAFQPLHLTVNHDGQLTGSDGVHLRLELGLVDDRIESYESALRGRLSPPEPVADLRSALFDAFTRTYPLIDTIMRADRTAEQSLWRYGPFYYRRLDGALHPAIERQLGDAATLLAATWSSACGDLHLDGAPVRQ